MTRPQRVLVTGNEGFIGSIMAPFLARSGFDVVGLDTGYYRDCNLVEPDGSIPTIDKDIRDLTADDVRGFDAVVHLAALSNDPIGNLDTGWTADINDRAFLEQIVGASIAIKLGVGENKVQDLKIAGGL